MRFSVADRPSNDCGTGMEPWSRDSPGGELFSQLRRANPFGPPQRYLAGGRAEDAEGDVRLLGFCARRWPDGTTLKVLVSLQDTGCRKVRHGAIRFLSTEDLHAGTPENHSLVRARNGSC